MADFTTLVLDANTGTNASPTYTALGGANTEIRWSDVGTGLLATASASWPAMVRPLATAQIAFTYAYTADAVGLGFIGTGSNPATYSITNEKWARWRWDNLGTFASAPIFTAYNTNAHAAPAARATPAGGLLEGHVTDTGATARSYLKANLYGQVDSVAPPAADPTNAPVVTDGALGSVSPGAATSWLTNFQGLMADLDYITFRLTPAATVADSIHCHFSLFTGPNMTPGVLVPVMSLKYTFT